MKVGVIVPLQTFIGRAGLGAAVDDAENLMFPQQAAAQLFITQFARAG